jgi:hypothetical protein
MGESTAPAAAPMKASRIAALMDGLRRTPIGRELMPMEAAVACPIPYRTQGKTYVILPFYTRVPAQSGHYAVFPWTAAFTFDWLTQQLVEYQDFRFKSAWTADAFSEPLTFVPSFGPEQVERSLQLFSMYDQLLDNLSLQGELPPFWMPMFKELLREFVVPEHHGYYRHAAPKFYERFLAH